MPLSADTLCAQDSPLRNVLRNAGAFAARECPVFIQGESGTGKEVLARYLHQHSPRHEGPFVAVNCAAIAPNLVESELFGHCKGAFTGALSDRPGRFRQARGGTLFLDEIGDMPLELQGRLLRVLQERKMTPVGHDREIDVDFRLLCATHRNLSASIRAGKFREDLYYRLRVLELRLPPLRDRPMDIPFLLRRFLAEQLDPEGVDTALRDFPAALLRHDFPGNVRELRNLAERYAALSSLGEGWAGAWGTDRGATVEGGIGIAVNPLRNTRLRENEILAALATCGYHRGRAADKLGVSRRALQYRLARMQSLLPK